MSSWNVNKSSARYDFLRDVAQRQVDVAMFQENQNWHEDGAAAEVAWRLLQVEKEGKAAIAVRKNMNLLKHSRRSAKWALIVLESILFLSLYLPHTWGGEANLEKYCKTLKEVGRNMQDVKQKFHVSGIIAGTDAQVEVKPHQRPFVGGGTRMHRANYCEMEGRFESLFVDWTQTPFAKGGSPQEQRQTGLFFGNRARGSFRCGRSLITLLLPSTGKQGAQWQGIVALKI